MGVASLMLVREAGVDDARAIGDVHAEAWRVACRDLFESDFLAAQVESRRALWSDVMAQPSFADSTVLVAERGNRVVAFMSVGPCRAFYRNGEIRACYAHPSVWGTGVASLLMNEALDVLADGGHLRVRLWALAGANRARGFLLKSGFGESGRTRASDFGDGRPVREREYVRGIPKRL